MKLAIAQIETTVGDFEENCDKVCRYIEKAKEYRCHLIVFPELALVGYHPMDLICKKGFFKQSKKYWERIRQCSNDIVVIVGSLSENQKRGAFYNSALVFSQEKIKIVGKKNLKNIPPIYEGLYFTPFNNIEALNINGKKVLLTVGNDINELEPFKEDVDFVINIDSLAYRERAIDVNEKRLMDKAETLQTSIVWVNAVGENLGDVFYGGSLVVNPQGIVLRSGLFEEDFQIYDEGNDLDIKTPAGLSWEEEIIETLVYGFKSYLKKSGFKKAVVGLSGGIDSALTACLARLAIGPENVVTISMPGPFSSKGSVEDGKELAKRLGVEFHIIPITSLYELSLKLFEDLFRSRESDITEENLQARLRAIILMSYSNKFKALVLNTGNKSEAAVGYATLYGDSVGAISLVGDLYKTYVYKIARYINKKYGWIPDRILTKPPSAELRAGQRDEDDIPPYEMLDSILKLFLDKNLSKDEIIAKGFSKEVVEEVIRRFYQNEYKRRQSPFCIKVTDSYFKRDMLPIVYKL